jgi:glycosyltransferase involved in cell wall biosynthesis
MKILLTTHLFLPDFFAGTEILACSTAKELQRLGHDVEVLTGFPGRKDLADAERFDHYEYDGIPVTRFLHADVPMGRERDVLKMEYDNRFVAEWFRGYLERVRPDIVHFFHLARLSASLIDVCEESGVPMVLTPTDFWFVCPTGQLRLPDNSCCQGPDRFSVNCIRHLDFIDKPDEMTIVKRVPDWFIVFVVLLARLKILPRRRFGFVCALSERAAFLMKRLNSVGRVMIPSGIMEQILLKNGLNRELTRFSSFGLNLEYIPENLSRLRASDLRVGFIGSLYEHKGIRVLLEAMQILQDEEKIVLKIYGENREQPDYVSQLQKMAAADQRITFCGTFPNSLIGEVLAGIDLLVVPSTWYENTPLVLYSAMAAACPVIASNMGGMSEVIRDGENGLLVEAGDSLVLAEALKLLANDRKLLDKLAAGCQRPKSIGGYVSELLKVYHELLPTEVI